MYTIILCMVLVITIQSAFELMCKTYKIKITMQRLVSTFFILFLSDSKSKQKNVKYKPEKRLKMTENARMHFDLTLNRSKYRLDYYHNMSELVRLLVRTLLHQLIP